MSLAGLKVRVLELLETDGEGLGAQSSALRAGCHMSRLVQHDARLGTFLLPIFHQPIACLVLRLLVADHVWHLLFCQCYWTRSS